MGVPEGSEGDGCRVSQQGEAGGFERSEAEADEDRSADGYGSSEAGDSFEECSEGKGDEEELEAAVGSDADEAVLQGMNRPARVMS